MADRGPGAGRRRCGMDDSGDPRIQPLHVAELSEFFAAHGRWLFGQAGMRTCGGRELAADLVQDTFEGAAQAWPALRERAGGRQRAWLLGTLANKDVSDFRHKEAFRRRQPDIQARYQASEADTAAQALNAIALRRARESSHQRPPRQRKIALVRWQGPLEGQGVARRAGAARGARA